MLGKEEIISPNLEELKSHYHSIITLLGEDTEREGLLKTPERVAKAMLSLTKGYHMDPHEVLQSALSQHRVQDVRSNLRQWFHNEVTFCHQRMGEGQFCSGRRGHR